MSLKKALNEVIHADSETNVKVCVTYLKPFKWEYIGQNNVNLKIYAACLIDQYVW